MDPQNERLGLGARLRYGFFPKLPFLVVLPLRTLYILALTGFFALAWVLGPLAGPAARPRVMRLYLQWAGAIFIKFGQVLAMRYDLLPAAYCNELSNLLDKMPAVPFPYMRRAIERSLGGKMADFFAEVEPVAIGAASIAQVHRGRLRTGERVVVKVARPGNKHLFRTDFAFLRWGGLALNALGFFKRVDMRAILRDLIQLTREELDFGKEATNLRRMHKLMAADDFPHYAPAVYKAVSRGDVLVMEYIEGVSVVALLAATEGQSKDPAQLPELQAQAKKASELLLRSILRQIIRYRSFHADPHAANLILMPDGRLAWIDFGMAGWLDERAWDLQLKLRIAIAAGNVEVAYRHLLTTLEPLPPRDLAQFESETKEYLRDWMESGRDDELGLMEKSSGYFFVRLFDAIRRAGLSLPSGLSRLYRAIIIADMVMLKLDPQIDWVGILRDQVTTEQRHILQQQFAAQWDALQLATAAETWLQFPQAMAAVVEWARVGLPEASRKLVRSRAAVVRVSLRLTGAVAWLCALAVAGALLEAHLGDDLLNAVGGRAFVVAHKGSILASGIVGFVLARILRRELQADE